MNSAQRLLRIAVVVLVICMGLFPPYIIREDVKSTRWVCYGPIWQAPYPAKSDVLPSQPYCPEGQPDGFLLLAQLTVLWMGSSYLYSGLGKLAWDPDKYPEYYRP